MLDTRLLNAATADPIFGAIAAHRAAWKLYGGAVRTNDLPLHDDPRDGETQRQDEARVHDMNENCRRAVAKLSSTRPTTPAGIIALARYAEEIWEEEFEAIHDDNPKHLLLSIAAAVEELWNLRG